MRQRHGGVHLHGFAQGQITGGRADFDGEVAGFHMPIMDGISTAKQIRKLERKDNDIPIVAISADGFEEDEEKSRKAGMNVHLRKPVDPNLLYETIQRLLDL